MNGLETPAEPKPGEYNKPKDKKMDTNIKRGGVTLTTLLWPNLRKLKNDTKNLMSKFNRCEPDISVNLSGCFPQLRCS
jgi:hypothetical protein